MPDYLVLPEFLERLAVPELKVNQVSVEMMVSQGTTDSVENR